MQVIILRHLKMKYCIYFIHYIDRIILRKKCMIDLLMYKKVEMIFMNNKNSKTSEKHLLRLLLTDKLNLENYNKNIALVNLSIFYTFKNIKNSYDNNKFKIYSPSWIKHLIYQIDHIQLKIFKIILNLLLKKMNLYQIIRQ